MILEENLKLKSWKHKICLYENLFEKFELLRRVLNPKISIIVVGWEYSSDIKKNLEILFTQKNDSMEIILVNNGCGDSEWASLKPYINKYVVLSKNSGACIARNLGSIFAEGRILLFVDDDGIPDAHFIKGHILTHEMYDVIAVRGACLPKNINNPFNSDISHYFVNDSVCPSFLELEGNTSIRAEVFFKVGGWDDQLFYGHEGLDLSIRLLDVEPDISKQVYSPLPILFHDFTENDKTLERKKEKQLLSWRLLEKKHPAIRLIRDFWLNSRSKCNDIKYNKCSTSFLLEFEKQLLNSKARYFEYLEQINVEHYNLQNFNHYSKLMKMINECPTQIYLFGAGEKGRHIYSLLKKMNIEIQGFIDNGQENWGLYIDSKKISRLDEISSNSFIMIASTWEDEISNQLIEEGFSLNKDFVKLK